MLVTQEIISEDQPSMSQMLFWDLPSGQLRLERIENLDLEDLYLSPDGTRYAIFHNTCHSENPKPCLLEVWSIPANERVISFDPGFVQAAAFSPDNRLIALGTDKEIAIWDTHTGTLLRSLPNSFRLDYLKFSNDGELLAGFQRQGDGHIQIWQVKSGELRATLAYRLYPMIMFPDAMGFLPGDTHLVITYGGSAESWRVSDWREGPAWQWNKRGGITDIAFSPDGRLIASGASDGSITLADPATGKVLARWDSHTDDTYDYITALCFTPDGRLLISLSMDGTLRFWGIKAE
jgi:WD40 repeat protein